MVFNVLSPFYIVPVHYVTLFCVKDSITKDDIRQLKFDLEGNFHIDKFT